MLFIAESQCSPNNLFQLDVNLLVGFAIYPHDNEIFLELSLCIFFLNEVDAPRIVYI